MHKPPTYLVIVVYLMNSALPHMKHYQQRSGKDDTSVTMVLSLLTLAQLSVNQTIQRVSSRGFAVEAPKTAKSRRTIALAPSLCTLFRKRRERQIQERLLLGLTLRDSDLVFARLDGKPLDPDTVTHAFKKIVRKAGMPHVRFHDLRHTHASLMLKQGIHPKIVSERLGHSSIGITLDTYSHVMPGLQEAAARRFEEDLLDARATQLVKG